MIENQHTEYKQKLTDELEKEVVAFLNSKEGGVIYLGIDKHGNTVGLNDVDQTQLVIKDRLKNNILPSCLGLFDVVIENKEDKDLVKIIVASGPEKPYYVKKYGLSEKGTFIRLGSASEPMPTRMIENLFAKRTRNSIGKIKSPKQELTFQLLQIYYHSIGKVLNEQFVSNLELINEDGNYNYAAYLLNDINNVSVKVAKYVGLTRVDLIENNEYGYECLIKAIKAVLDKLNIENKTSTRITGRERIEQRVWNAVALREAVINAFVHNDYTRELAPKFEIFDDRLEITSYGGLPEGMEQEEFFSGYSIPRNKELMRIFKDLDLVEQLGSGIPRILKHYSKENFKFSENFLRIILPSNHDQLPESQGVVQMGMELNEAKRLFSDLESRIQIGAVENKLYLRGIYGVFTEYLQLNYYINTQKIVEEYGERALFIIELMYLNSEITRQQIADILGVSLSTVEKDINKLRSDKFINRMGSDKVGTWIISRKHSY